MQTTEKPAAAGSDTTSHAHASSRLLIVDDDPTFGRIMLAAAKKGGFRADWYPSLLDMGSFARIREYDVAIIDYFLDSVRGDEIAQYADAFFADIPIILVSAYDFPAEEVARWSPSVKQFMAKSLGPQRIVENAAAVLRRCRLLHQLESKDSPRPEH